MFYYIEAEDVVRIPPSFFRGDLDAIALEVLKAKYEGGLSPDVGYVLLVKEAKVERQGKIVPGDGATYHRAQLTLLTYLPLLNEVVEGEVVEVEKFGALINVGPLDALLHISQITDEFVTVDERQGVLLASKSQQTLSRGDAIRARITAVSLGRGMSLGKVSLTCKQPSLGPLKWMKARAEKKEVKQAAKQAA
jgi:DNA-directed RNA polymerase subunit E'